ncbi:Hpt domain-containing protein [Leptospira sp. GIMC2001]|uniref:Hpt domain-containing protein n=1 Tax=Leptospira sp. GIMC2001 TaxID=1513297 RepID=UPI0023499E84|nr:Hpt domain-containing protein [Leptospira sp. GIMC2001]WCL48887.1 Hpt domain-containing protein [Leptospira sp. GIMC2001]
MVIDWSRIEALIDGDKPEDRAWITEMIGTLRENMQVRMINIQNSIQIQDHEKLQFELHQIKGVAANFGLDKLFNLVLESENSLKSGNTDQGVDMASKIQLVWIETQTELDTKFPIN